MILVAGCGGRDFLEIVFQKRARSSSFHLLEIVLAAHIAHEDKAFDGLYIRASCNHVDGDGDTRIIVVAEGAQDAFGVLGGVSDLLAELVALAKLLTDDLDDIVGMAVGLGEYQRFRDFLAAREQRRLPIIPERADNGADMAWIDDVPVELRRRIIHILVKLLPAFLA